MIRFLATLFLLPLLASTCLALAGVLLSPSATAADTAPTLGATIHFALYIFVFLVLVSVPMIVLGWFSRNARAWHAVLSGSVIGAILALSFRDSQAASYAEQLLPAVAMIVGSSALSLALWSIGFRGNRWFDRIAGLGR